MTFQRPLRPINSGLLVQKRFILDSSDLRSTVLADEFEFGFMEGVETQFEEIMITEAEGAGEQAARIFR
jgi:hypothetical protein